MPVPRRVDLCLDRGATIRGRALGTRGEPLAQLTIEIVGDDDHWGDAGTTRADGAFELPNHPGGAGTVLLTRAAGDVPLASVSNVSAAG